MPSTVYFIDLRAGHKENLANKVARLMTTAGLSEKIKARDLVAVKLHFGEKGNTAFVRPVYLRKIVETIKGVGGYPFLTDANTVYAGTRSDSPHHLTTAIQNGFAYAVVDAPLVIADGLRGKSEIAVPVGLKRFKEVFIGADIVEADALISIAHFKLHELSGFGGTLKNLGMGCASRRGKLAQHSTVAPKVKKKKCVGCGECILICPESAIEIQWNQAIPVFLENMVEYTVGVLKNKQGKTLYLNFITDISPACDCYGHNDAPIVKDIGIVAASDPVAIDQASVDLINREQALPDCCLQTNTGPGEDKIRGVYPEIEWEIQLDYAEQLGLGTRRYRLERI